MCRIRRSTQGRHAQQRQQEDPLSVNYRLKKSTVLASARERHQLSIKALSILFCKRNLFLTGLCLVLRQGIKMA